MKNIILVFYLCILCVTRSKKCRLIDSCGECGICIWNKDLSKEYCETKFLKQIFHENPPLCSVSNKCKPQTCLNGGTCKSTFGSFSCLCSNNYFGQNCSLLAEPDKKYASGLMVAYLPTNNVLEHINILVSIDDPGEGNFQVMFHNGDGDTVSYNETDFYNGYTRPVCDDIIRFNKACKMISNSKRTNYIVFKTIYPYLDKGKNLIKQSDVEEGVPKIIGKQIEFQIIFVNYGKEWFIQKFPMVVNYRVKKNTDCIPSVVLKNCGDNPSDLPFTRKSTNTIRSIVKPNRKCQGRTDFLLEWNIYFYGNSFNEERNLFKQERKISEYVIKPFSMKTGLYKVKLWANTTFVRNKVVESFYNFDFCYFEIVELPIIAIIKGGRSRSVYSQSSLILDGSLSSDPNEPPTNQHHLLYSWNCDKPVSVCRNYTSKSSRYELTEPLTPGETYNFNLKVEAEGTNLPPGLATQVINAVGTKIKDIEIVCLRNCGIGNFKSNPKEIIYFQVEVVGDPTGTKGMTFSWTYSEGSGPDRSVNDIKVIDTPNNILIIKENMLSEGKKFDFSVEVADSEGKYSFAVETFQSPEGGTCTISPESGVAGTTFFSIVCQDFRAMNDLAGLRYEFYEEDPSAGVLLGFNTIGKLQEVVLSKNAITVRVTDLLGMYVDKYISVEISPLSRTSEIVQVLIERVNKLLQYGDKSGSVRLISTISDLTVEMDGKPEIIQTLLDFIDKVKYTDFMDIKRYSHILKKIVTKSVEGNANGLNSGSCKVAARIMKKLSKKVLGEFVNKYNKSTEITGLQLQNVIRVVLQTADVLLSSRDPMVFNQSAGALQVFSVYRNFKQVASDVILSIEKLGRSVGHLLLPAQPEVIFQTNKSTLWIKLDTPERLNHMNQIPSTGNSFIKISEALMNALNKRSDVIRVEVAVLQENPYWWDQNEINIRTEIISLRLFLKVSRHMILVQSLPEPIDIFFKLSDFQNQQVSGLVTKPNLEATDDEKDKAVSVHRLDTLKSGGSGKIIILFRNLKPHETLKVIVMKNIRPDYNMVNNEGFVVTNVSAKYDTFFMSDSPDEFLYIGILPGSEVQTNTTVVYNFEMYSVQCQTWSGGEWNSKICKVGALTTNDVVHCRCTHLSIFGGSILIAPNKLDPIKDISLFLTIPDNPAVVILVLTLLIFYLSTLVWAFSRDKRDETKKLVIVLEDNFPGEKWGYLIIVFTGARLFAGTTANVGFKITGELSSSRAHVFRSKNHKVLQKGSDDWFLIFTPKHLGELQTLHIWHDNSGPNPDWYCVKILVHDLSLNKEYSFLVESWLCIGSFGKYVEAVIKPSLPKDISNWNRLLATNAFYYFREAHLWISIFFCHPRTCLTRTQRVSIAVSLVMCSLLTSIMFYGVAAEEGVDEGSYSIKTREIIIAIESALITTPVTFLIVFLFRKSRFIESKDNQEESQEKNVIEKDENEYPDNLEKKSYTKKLFSSLSFVVHIAIKPKPLIPVQMSNTPTKTVVVKPKLAIVAWIICQATIWVSAFFIMLYGLKLGKTISELWMTATLFGIAQGVLITSPIKLFVYSFILSLAFRKSYTVTSFEINITEAMQLHCVGDGEFLTRLIKLRSQPEYCPLSFLTLKAMIEKNNLSLSWRYVKKFCIVSVFFIILLMAVNDTWSAKYYTTNSHVKIMFTDTKEKNGVSLQDIFNIASKCVLSKISALFNATSHGPVMLFADYLLSTLIPAIYTSKWYNKSLLGPKGNGSSSKEWTSDANTRLLSIPRLRQIRVKPDLCKIPDNMENLTMSCVSDLSDATEDTTSYDTKWTPSYNFFHISSPWIYHPPRDTSKLFGNSGKSYHSGGYIAKLGVTHKEANFIISKLIDNGWFDGLTKVIFVEMALYNINTNTISQVSFVVEQMLTGDFLTKLQVISISASIKLHGEIWFIIFLPFAILFLVQIILKITELGLVQFVLSFWNLLELCICMLCFVYLISHIVQLIITSRILENFEQSGKEGYLDLLEVYNHKNLLLFLLIFLTTLQTLKCFQLGHQVHTFYYTVKLSYCYVLWAIVVIFIFLFYLGWILSAIFSSPIFSNRFVNIMNRISYSVTTSEVIFFKQKVIKYLYCFSCGIGSVICLIIIVYYYRIGKFYKYHSNHINILKIFINKIKSLSIKRQKFRLRGGTDFIENHQHVQPPYSESSSSKGLYETKTKLMIYKGLFNVLKDKCAILQTNNSDCKSKISKNELLNNYFASSHCRPYFMMNSHKISYNKTHPLENIDYFKSVISKLDCAIATLDRIEGICNSSKVSVK